jgi:hypothetical protein
LVKILFLGVLLRVDGGIVADSLVVHTTSIFWVDFHISTSIHPLTILSSTLKMEAACTSEMSETLATSAACKDPRADSI